MRPDFDCIVVANGLFPTRPEILDCLRGAPVIIACDGAALKLLERGFMPGAIIGDLDSLPEELKHLPGCEVVQAAEQVTNDLTKAVRFAHGKGHMRLLILGATGLREDHTLGNIGLLTEYVSLFDAVEMVSDFGVFTPIKTSRTFQSVAGQQVSIFCITAQTEVTSRGLRWEVSERRFECWWEGTLNEATGNEFTISFEGKGRIVVYQAVVDCKQGNEQ